MNILTILILSSVVNADIFDVFKRDSCDLSSCQSAANSLSQKCDENDATFFLCVCDKMPDSFFQNLHDCAVGCGEDQDQDIPDATSLKSIYCELASETGFVTGFGGFGGFGDLTDDGSDFDIGSETIDIGTESDESKTTGTESKTTGTTESNTNGSKTTNSGTTSTETSSAKSETSSAKSETSSSKSETTSKATTANSAAIINSGLFSCIALMIAMLM